MKSLLFYGNIIDMNMMVSPSRFSLLMVDDEPAVISSLKRVFFDDDYDLHSAQSGEDALEIMGKARIDAALVDLKMPGMDGFALLKEMKKASPALMVIMLTGHGGIKEAVEAMKLGADDFLEKPFSPEGLRARVAQLHNIWALREENRALRDKIESQFGFDHLIGNATAMLRLKETIAHIGPGDTSVLIQGETGTGKELVARAIHYHSLRSEKSFVPVDCAAISETVIESELFGHLKGAFTGAHISTLGLIRSADKGTLFLDEVGELSPAIQAKLLRTIQEREVRPVGSSTSYPVDVRIVAATNRDLTEEVSLGNFREDLFYRLNVVAINVLPLRDRREDIPLLANFFLKRFATDFSPVEEISKEALICLENHNWPGNIRELENVLRRAVALGKGQTIMPEDLPSNIHLSPEEPSLDTIRVSEDSLDAYEEAAIRNALGKSGQNRKRAAEILGIGEATLYRKIKKYGISG
ncbi:MAG: sigma-54 dependent transcriptional regulator [Thermodesulfobacteriota bacterium]|nr:sigma-54 dependent transcriptional regulator [Thermodesulfobacteriota bacterium]